jgi:hypothetical protein
MVKGLWNYHQGRKDRTRDRVLQRGARRQGAAARRGPGLRLRPAPPRRHASHPVRESALPGPARRGAPLGLPADAYEVDDFDAQIARLHAAGVRFLMAPQVIESKFGKRKIAFLETPDGVRPEVIQILEDAPGD